MTDIVWREYVVERRGYDEPLWLAHTTCGEDMQTELYEMTVADVKVRCAVHQTTCPARQVDA
jgi:hypothetical protein